jgi:hypothetical protein
MINKALSPSLASEVSQPKPAAPLTYSIASRLLYTHHHLHETATVPDFFAPSRRDATARPITHRESPRERWCQVFPILSGVRTRRSRSNRTVRAWRAAATDSLPWAQSAPLFERIL